MAVFPNLRILDQDLAELAEKGIQVLFPVIHHMDTLFFQKPVLQHTVLGSPGPSFQLLHAAGFYRGLYAQLLEQTLHVAVLINYTD